MFQKSCILMVLQPPVPLTLSSTQPPHPLRRQRGHQLSFAVARVGGAKPRRKFVREKASSNLIGESRERGILNVIQSILENYFCRKKQKLKKEKKTFLRRKNEQCLFPKMSETFEELPLFDPRLNISYSESIIRRHTPTSSSSSSLSSTSNVCQRRQSGRLFGD